MTYCNVGNISRGSFLLFDPFKQFSIVIISFIVVRKKIKFCLVNTPNLKMKGSMFGSSLSVIYNMSSLSGSLGFYASMIKDALEKTISEGKVCLSADYDYFHHTLSFHWQK